MDNGTQSETAPIYNLTSNTFKPFHITEEAEASGTVLLPDGRGLLVGGERAQNLEYCVSDGWLRCLGKSVHARVPFSCCLS